MPGKQSPPGVYVRDFAWRNLSRLMGGGAFSSAHSSLFSYVEVFNNSVAGEYLVMLSVQGWAQSTTSTFIVETYLGQKGAAALPGATPMDPSMPLGPGVIGTFTSPTCVGSHLLELGGNNLPAIWPHDFPFAVIPPGYSVAAQAALTDVGQQASFVWAYTTTPY